MTVRLVDTNIISFVMKAHPLAARYQPHLIGYTLAASFMTVAELQEGAVQAGWGSKRVAAMKATVNGLLILHSNVDICQQWAETRAVRKSQPISVADAWIAATALNYSLELVTHNPRDFVGIPGLIVISEAP